MIAGAGYFTAARRVFRDATPVQDWLEAEAEVDAILLRGSGAGDK
jgi:hypothetical protein